MNQQPTEQQNQTPSPQPKNKTGIIIAIIITVVVVFIFIIGILASMVLVSLDSARTKASDARTKSTLSQLRSTAEIYLEEKNTYVGLQNDLSYQELAKSLNNNIVFQNATANSYIAYTKLSTGKYFCVDSLGTSIELTKVSAIMTTCK